MKASFFFFDFDGVIVDSSDLKHKLFLEIAMCHVPDIVSGLDYALNTVLVGAERAAVGLWIEQNSGGVVSKDKFLEEFASRLETKQSEIKLVHGFREFFSDIVSLRIPSAIVSNAPVADITKTLRRYTIDPTSFAGIAGSSSLGKTGETKKIMEKLNLRSEHCIFFGDMPSDLEVANRLGLGFIRIESATGSTCQWPEQSYLRYPDFAKIRIEKSADSSGANVYSN